ncbi:MAG TPA: phosphoribosylformylglycinamidine cyclo-ligase [Parvularculaceae bacterium]|nr:phosphoribosylformylglycinamidine cyclo-ligase [Parvularculaceae bacterium]HNS85754.1 phosphoribosylformylglycinamidine cyclo-ligase [Parvularculaceae bacterium]
MSDAYKKAGVDIDAGERLVDAISPLARATARKGADAMLGGFGGVFDLKAAGFADPLLVSGTDGVGTKLMIAFETGIHSTIGVDLVAMCVNDVLAQGAEPLFFLDYFATGKLQEGVAADVIKGVAQGCLEAGCALIGGETAEMPGMYPAGEYDLAGFCVGAVERKDLMPRSVEAGDVMIAIPSSGPHSNGYSLIRKIVADARLSYGDPAPFDPQISLGEALLTPTRIYVKPLLALLKDEDVRGFAHITGGGLTDNVPRVFTENFVARYDESALGLPPVFEWLKAQGGLSADDMRRTFNCGVGGVLVVRNAAVERILNALTDKGETPRVIGDIAKA